jgi:hypothetical protein
MDHSIKLLGFLWHDGILYYGYCNHFEGIFMRPMFRFSTLLLTASLFGIAGCDLPRTNQPPKTGSLTQHLTMTADDGRVYGTVELDPINGGRIFDADGRLIGRVVTPAPAQLAPLAQ